jgi:hypothetical protein
MLERSSIMWNMHDYLPLPEVLTGKRLVRCLLISALSLLMSATPASADEPPIPIPVIAEGYLANRASFPFLKCRFSKFTGQAPSLADALNGKLQQRKKVADYLWIVNEPKTRFEIEFPHSQPPPKDKAQTPKSKPQTAENGQMRFIPIHVQGYKLLYDGQYTLNYSVSLRSLIVINGRQRMLAETNPFSLGKMGAEEIFNPGRLLSYALKGKGSYRYYGIQKSNGRDTLCIGTIGLDGGEQFRWFLDPEQGFLPIECWDLDEKSGRVLQRCFFTEVRKCSGNRWFPVRGVAVGSPNKQGIYENVFEYVVTELDVDHPPTEDEFTIEVPQGTQMGVPEEDLFGGTLGKTRRLGLADIPCLRGQAQQVTAAYQAQARAGASDSWRWFWPVVGVVTLVFGTMGWYWWRRRRTQQTSS